MGSDIIHRCPIEFEKRETLSNKQFILTVSTMETQVQTATHPHDPWAATHQGIFHSVTMDPKQRLYNHFTESVTGEIGPLKVEISTSGA